MNNQQGAGQERECIPGAWDWYRKDHDSSTTRNGTEQTQNSSQRPKYDTPFFPALHGWYCKVASKERVGLGLVCGNKAVYKRQLGYFYSTIRAALGRESYTFVSAKIYNSATFYSFCYVQERISRSPYLRTLATFHSGVYWYPNIPSRQGSERSHNNCK